MGKKYTYVESKELLDIAGKLKSNYITVVGYIDLDKIFFAFKGGDINESFTYEVLGLKNEWVKHATTSENETKMYCLAMSYDYYQKNLGNNLEWTLMEMLYSVHPNMDGKLRRKDVHEFSRFLNTFEDLEIGHNWRKNGHLPALLGEETILFGLEELVDDSV